MVGAFDTSGGDSVWLAFDTPVSERLLVGSQARSPLEVEAKFEVVMMCGPCRVFGT